MDIEWLMSGVRELQVPSGSGVPTLVAGDGAEFAGAAVERAG